MSTPSSLDTATFRHLLLNSSQSIAGFQIPPYDTIQSDDLKGQPSYIIFKRNGTQVARLNFTWDSGKLTQISVA